MTKKIIITLGRARLIAKRLEVEQGISDAEAADLVTYIREHMATMSAADLASELEVELGTAELLLRASARTRAEALAPTRSEISAGAPTWSEIAAIASAVDKLISGADLSHDLLVELASPLLRRLEIMHAQILLDPHGDSELPDDAQPTGPGE